MAGTALTLGNSKSKIFDRLPNLNLTAVPSSLITLCHMRYR